VDGAKVTGRVTCPVKAGEKIHLRTYRRRKGTRRHKGHRQKFTEVEITGITI
jgi:ribosomal protein L21